MKDVSMCSRNLGCRAGHVSVCVWMLFSNQPQKWRDCCPLLWSCHRAGLFPLGWWREPETTYPLTEAETGAPSTRPAPLSLSLCSSSHAHSRVIAFLGGRRWNVARCKNCGSLLLMAVLSYLNAGEEMKLIGSQSNGDVVDLQAAWV